MAKNPNMKRLKAFKPVPPRDPVMGGGTLPGFRGGKTPTGSTVAGNLPGFANSSTTGSTQAGVLPEFPQGGPVRGSTVAGVNMAPVGGPNVGTTIGGSLPDFKGTKKIKGSSITNEQLQKFHASRGKAKI